MSLAVKREEEVAADRAHERLAEALQAVAVLNELISYVLHTHRRRDTIVGHESVRKKVMEREPSETFSARVISVSVVKSYVDLPWRLYSKYSFLTNVHYFYSVTFEVVPATVRLYELGRRRRMFAVADAAGELLVADELPPRTLFGRVVVASLSRDPRFGDSLLLTELEKLYRASKAKVMDVYFKREKLFGSVVEVKSGNCSVADIMLKSVVLDLSTITPIRESITLEEGSRGRVEKASRVTVGSTAIFNPTDDALRIISRLVDPARADELRRATYDAILGVASFIEERIFESRLKGW